MQINCIRFLWVGFSKKNFKNSFLMYSKSANQKSKQQKYFYCCLPMLCAHWNILFKYFLCLSSSVAGGSWNGSPKDKDNNVSLKSSNNLNRFVYILLIRIHVDGHIVVKTFSKYNNNTCILYSIVICILFYYCKYLSLLIIIIVPSILMYVIGTVFV
jgi:hypothetical protein